jgi:hypothetical protein
MPEVSRELVQMTFDIDILLVPAHQRLNGEAVAKIVQAWPMAVVRAPQADLARELHKRGADRASGQSHPVLGDKKTGAFRDGIDVVAPLDILTECLWRGQMQRQTTRCAKLAVADGKQSVVEIAIGMVQPHKFTDTHASDHQQAEQRGVGVGAQPCGGRQATGSLKKLDNLGIAVERRRAPLRTVRE